MSTHKEGVDDKPISTGPGDMKIGGAYGDRVVAKGVKVKYTLDRVPMTYDANSGAQSPAYRVRWVVTYHYGRDDAEEPDNWQKDKDDAGNPTQLTYFTKKWAEIGHHRVHCLLASRDTGDPFLKLEVDQRVAEMETILQTQLIAAQKTKLSNPDAELSMMWKWLTLLKTLAERDWAKMSKADQDAHQTRMKEMEGHAYQLQELLGRSGDVDRRWPLRAVYLGKDTMDQKELRVYFTQKETDTKHVKLVDWTNLEEKELHGEYEVAIPPWEGRTKGQLIQAAFEEAIKKWKSKNKYAGGGVKYDFKGNVSGYDIGLSGTFDTGGTDLEEDIINFLRKIAKGAAYISLFLTGIGGPLAGAFLVASMVAGTTGAVLSIHHRHSRDEDEYLADIVDVLDVAANLLGVGARAGKAILWTEGRLIRITAADKVVEVMFVGEASASGFNGVFMGAKTLAEYQSIMNSNMLPEDRANALLKLFGQTAEGYLISHVNHKMATAKEKANWQELLEKDAVPRHIDDGPSGGKPPSKEGVPTHVDDQESGFHQVPSDGVPKPVNDNPNLDTRPNRTKVPPKQNDPDKTAPIKATDKPGFKGKTQDKEKKVTVVTKQKRQPTGGVPPGKETPTKEVPKTQATKKLGLGLKDRKQNLDYATWSKERGFTIYSDYGRGSFGEQIERGMSAAEEIHFNLEGVDVNRVPRAPNKMELNEYGEPGGGNYTTYELYLISTRKEYADKVKWWNGNRKSGEPEARDPDDFWPPGLNDPRK